MIKKINIKIISINLLLSLSIGNHSFAANNKIDVHVHLRSSSKAKTSQQEFSKKRKNKSGREVTAPMAAFKNLLEQMNRYGVQKVLLMPPPRIYSNINDEEFNNLLKVKEAYPNRVSVAGGGNVLNPLIHKYEADEVTPAVKEQFTTDARRLAASGITVFGEMAATHLSFGEGHVFEEASPDHPLFLLLSDIAAEYNIPIDFHMEAVPQDMPTPKQFKKISSLNPAYLKANITAFERLLSHNRNARIVWEHIGWDNTGCMTISLLRGLLERHPNLYLALRVTNRNINKAGEPIPNRIVDANGNISGEWLEFFREFPDRFVAGTDEFFGATDEAKDTSASFEETWKMIGRLPPDLKEKFGTTNAVKIYNIKLTDTP